MAVFVVGHGSYDAAEPGTFVPLGLELHFHADVDEGLLLSLGLRAVATGAAAGSRQQFGELETVPNYGLTGLSDIQRAAYAAADPQDGSMYVVGDHLTSPIMLCAGDQQTCDPRLGTHQCRGILGRLSAQREIHLIACRLERTAARERHEANQEQPYTMLVGAESDPQQFQRLLRLQARFGALVESDQDAAEDMLEKMDDAMRVYLLQNPWIRRWSYTRQAYRFLGEYRTSGLYRFYVRQPDDVRAVIDADPQLAERVRAMDNTLRAFRNGDNTVRTAIWTRLTDEQRADLIAVDDSGEIYRWATAPDEQGGGQQGGAGTDQPALEWAVIDHHNAAVLYGMSYGEETSFVQAGTMLLIGQDTSYWQVGQYIGAQQGAVLGSLLVFKPMRPDGDPTASGSLTVTGCADPDGFTAALARIPPDVFRAEVTFT